MDIEDHKNILFKYEETQAPPDEICSTALNNSSNSSSSIIICDFCQDVLEEPIAIPCDHTICKKHLVPNRACTFCSECHTHSFTELKKLAAVVRNLFDARHTVASTAQLYDNVQFNAGLVIDERVQQVRREILAERDKLLADLACALEVRSDELLARLETTRQELYAAADSKSISKLALELDAEMRPAREKLAQCHADLKASSVQLSEPLWAQIRSEALHYQRQLAAHMRVYASAVFGSHKPEFFVSNRPDIATLAHFGELALVEMTPAVFRKKTHGKLTPLAKNVTEPARRGSRRNVCLRSETSTEGGASFFNAAESSKTSYDWTDHRGIVATTSANVRHRTTGKARHSLCVATLRHHSSVITMPTSGRSDNRSPLVRKALSRRSSMPPQTRQKQLNVSRRVRTDDDDDGSALPRDAPVEPARASAQPALPWSTQAKTYLKPAQRRLLSRLRLRRNRSSFENVLYLRPFDVSALKCMDSVTHQNSVRNFVRTNYGPGEFTIKLYNKTKWTLLVCLRRTVHKCNAKVYLYMTHGYEERVGHHTCGYQSPNGDGGGGDERQLATSRKINIRCIAGQKGSQKTAASVDNVFAHNSSWQAIKIENDDNSSVTGSPTVDTRVAIAAEMNILHSRKPKRLWRKLIFCRQLLAFECDAEFISREFLDAYVAKYYCAREFRLKKLHATCAVYFCFKKSTPNDCNAIVTFYFDNNSEVREGVHTCGHRCHQL